MSQKQLRRSGKGREIVKKAVIGAVGVSTFALAGYGLVKLVVPRPSPIWSESTQIAPSITPPAISPANRVPPTGGPGGVWPQESAPATGWEAQLHEAVTLSQYEHLVTRAESLTRTAEAESSLACRVLRYCEAKEIYEDVGEILETIQACSQNCEQSKLRAKAQLAYIELRFRPIANAMGCVVEQKVCACLAEVAKNMCN